MSGVFWCVSGVLHWLGYLVALYEDGVGFFVVDFDSRLFRLACFIDGFRGLFPVRGEDAEL